MLLSKKKIMKMKNYLILGIVVLLFSSCDDFLEKSPSDELSTSTFWSSEENVQAAVTATYAYLGDEWWTTFLNSASDDSYAWSTWPCDVLYVTDGSAVTSLGTFEHFWDYYYQGITAANNVIDNIDGVELDEATYNQLKSEVRFIRAYAYHRLIGLYGDVPLVKTVLSDPADYMVSRTSKSEIVDFIVGELDEIAKYLPTKYDASEFGKITKGTALALEARVLLYDDKFTEAAAVAKEVMDLKVYSIDDDYISLFDGTNEQSNEILLSAQYTTNYKSSLATWIGGPFVGGWSEVVPLQSLVDAYECTDGKTIDESGVYDANKPFENRDPRLSMAIVLPGGEINGSVIDITFENSSDGLGQNNASYSGYYYRKGVATEVSGSYDSNCTNDIVLIRYAEVLLTYAEAKIEANSIDQSVYDAINQVRGRTGVQMPFITTGKSQDELIEIVRRERHVEMAGEQERLFDIRRWKMADVVLNGPVYGILNNFDSNRSDYGANVLVGTRIFNASRDYLWPVPQSEMDINENLMQNSNW